jgi:hypothetical protein
MAREGTSHPAADTSRPGAPDGAFAVDSAQGPYAPPPEPPNAGTSMCDHLPGPLQMISLH